jgi:hypothetical protein
MKPLATTALWCIGGAEALGCLSAVVMRLLGHAWQRSIGDTLFVEGALFLVAAGMLDLARSITAQRIRALSQAVPPPPAVAKPGRLVILVIVGLLLCGQGILLVHVLSPGGR